MGNCYVRHWPGLAEAGMGQIEGHHVQAHEPTKFVRERGQESPWARGRVLEVIAKAAERAPPLGCRPRNTRCDAAAGGECRVERTGAEPSFLRARS